MKGNKTACAANAMNIAAVLLQITKSLLKFAAAAFPCQTNMLPLAIPAKCTVQKNNVYVRLQTDAGNNKHQNNCHALPPFTPGFLDMLKKMIVVSPGTQSGRIGMHLATGSRGHETTDASQQRTRRAITSHWYVANPDLPAPAVFTAAGSIEHWRLLLKQLSLLVGSKGSAAIFLKSVDQLGAQYPALATLNPMHSWPEQLAILQNTLQQLPPSSAAMAQQSLWWRGCQLLSKLLGESLSRRLLQQVQFEQSAQHHG
jgi:hypothetical protein